MADRIGQQLGNYRLVRLLGQGGFAEVYLAEHTLLGTTAALKVLRAQVTQDDVAQFQREARLLASLKHRHIIQVFDFGIDGQTPYLVMEYAPNGTLRTRHPKGTILSLSTVIDYVKQVAEALQYAHDRKVVHRDIKPENMLIGENNAILLSDFGIALITESARYYQSAKDMVGTIAYMAPEQIDARPRLASDQYSLGIIVYEWLCGTWPFHGSYSEIAVKHSVTPPPAPRQYLPMLSPDVEHVILTALAKQPEKRFTSVSAFATALEQASQDMLPTERSRPRSGLVPVSPSTPPQPVEPSVAISTRPNPFVPMPAIQAPPALPNLPEKKTNQPRVSRRAALVGVASIAAVATVGAGVFTILRQHTQDQIMTPPTLTPFTYRGHSDRVTFAVWSPDGKRVASSSYDQTVQVWNANDGGNLFTYRGHSGWVWSLMWSPDGKRVASSSSDKTVQVWNADDGGNLFVYHNHSDGVNAVVWSPKEQRIASGSSDKTVQVWDASSGGRVFTYKGHSDTVWSVVWSPDGQKIASGSADKTVQVWNASDGNSVLTYRGHDSYVFGVAWSPDGKQIASSSADNTVQVWDASDGSHLITYTGHTGWVVPVAWSPDGKWIASGSKDTTVRVWNASDGSNIFTYRGHTDGVQSIAWLPDGKWIVSGSFDNTVQIWSVR